MGWFGMDRDILINPPSLGDGAPDSFLRSLDRILPYVHAGLRDRMASIRGTCLGISSFRQRSLLSLSFWPGPRRNSDSLNARRGLQPTPSSSAYKGEEGKKGTYGHQSRQKNERCVNSPFGYPGYGTRELGNGGGGIVRILLRKQPRPDGRCPDMAISIFCPLVLTLFDIGRGRRWLKFEGNNISIRFFRGLLRKMVAGIRCFYRRMKTKDRLSRRGGKGGRFLGVIQEPPSGFVP